MNRYHVVLGSERTTVSLDTMLSELLALKLKAIPNSEEAHQAIRMWLQALINEANDPGRRRMSQWLQSQAILFLVDKKLSNRWEEYIGCGMAD